MDKAIANHRVNRNTVKRNSPRRIVLLTSGLRFPHDWGAVHTIILDHGYGFIRIGKNLVGFPAEVEEGKA